MFQLGAGWRGAGGGHGGEGRQVHIHLHAVDPSVGRSGSPLAWARVCGVPSVRSGCGRARRPAFHAVTFRPRLDGVPSEPRHHVLRGRLPSSSSRSLALLSLRAPLTAPLPLRTPESSAAPFLNHTTQHFTNLASKRKQIICSKN